MAISFLHSKLTKWLCHAFSVSLIVNLSLLINVSVLPSVKACFNGSHTFDASLLIKMAMVLLDIFNLSLLIIK